MSDFVVGQRPHLEVADVIRSHGEAFLQKYGRHLTATQKKALRDLALCRTAALGGHVEQCLDCGHERVSYCRFHLATFAHSIRSAGFSPFFARNGLKPALRTRNLPTSNGTP